MLSETREERGGEEPREDEEIKVRDMNPLYIDNQRVGLGVEGFSLYVKDIRTSAILHNFAPRSCPYDSIIIQRPNGFISFAAINWLIKHNISLTILDWRGNVLSHFLPDEPISNELRIAQVKAYLDPKKHNSIANKLVETKLSRQREFLESLSDSYPKIVVPFPRIRNSSSLTFLRASEAKYAIAYFTEFGKACEQIGYQFRGRGTRSRNQHAVDLPNALLNYSYSLLKTYLRRALNSVGLDNSIAFVHELKDNTGLVYDLMEFWRTNCDYSVLETLKSLKRQKRTHYLTDGFEAMLEPATVRTLYDIVKLNLSLEEIISNCRILARFLLGKSQSLEFDLRPIRVKMTFETDAIRELILAKSAKQLGMPKATLWYQKHKLKETGSVRLYNVSRHYFTRNQRIE
ncbi:MAG: CRISPR-associated endonuclease Cas1 [Nitrososphaerales archaeon]